MTEEHHTASQTPRRNRRQKTTSEKITEKRKQLAKAKDSLKAIQDRIKTLEEELLSLDGQRVKELRQEYGVSLSELEALLAANKDRKGGTA